MSLDLGMSFGTLTLEGWSAQGFTELFENAKKVLDTIPAIRVQFHFNGYMIVVNDNTAQSAWEMYLNKEFKKIG